MYQEFKTLISPITTTHQMLYQKLKSIPSSLLVLPHNDQAYVLYDKHTDARLVSVCVSTLYILAPCPQPGVFSAPLAWDRAKVGERRPGEVPQPSSHPPTRPIPQHVKCPILHPALHCPPGVPQCNSSSAAPAPRPARAQHN